MTADADTLRSEIRKKLPELLPHRLGVAVSGGSDSTALMRLLGDIARAEGIELFAATVDHGLRPESVAEAASVAAQADRWGIPHETLKWTGWDKTGNLQDAARRARYELLIDWANQMGLKAIALGHTADDQAETVLMRMARAAGVSGLSAMASMRREHNVSLLRPMLSIPRERLRKYLRSENIRWIDDPSNQDQRFDRIKARAALSQLAPLGITADTLSRVAENLAQAREALAHYAQESAMRVVQAKDAGLCIDQDAYSALPMEIRRRILAAAAVWIAGGGYSPRHRAVEQAMNAILNGQTTTIGGCLLYAEGKKTWISRELNTIAHQTARPGEIWDKRWILTGPRSPNAQIRALGEDGILQVEDWRSTGVPRAVLVSTPAVWSENMLIAAPIAGFPNHWRVEAPSERPSFHASILSH
ncbi:tRNA lysidine(34) synthetase TilS [Ruegeria sp.]|uniref:tRNA lysidine(34) synthetase TilS n=1 Tax=Ruegeria sp. TaxID=1879320 RepID=UPI003C7E46A1